MNFSKHNMESERIWKLHREGRAERMPVVLGINPRIWLLDGRLNSHGITFKEYTEDVNTMVHVQMRSAHYIRHNLWADHEMGLPKEGWHVYVDLQNYYEAGWFGGEVAYPRNNSPMVKAFLFGDEKERLFWQGIPDPFGGVYIRALEQYEQMQKMVGKREYAGRHIAHVGLPSHHTDGPLTVACCIMGATEFCLAIYEEPDFAEKLLDFITEATIVRIKAWNKRFGEKELPESFSFADDSISHLSPDIYRDLVLPRHKRLVNELSKSKRGYSFHACGDATRHFKLMQEELGIRSFDTGFPVKHGELVKELGPDTEVLGGPHVDLLLRATPKEIEEETKRILDEVMPCTRRFVMREANNLSPGTPPENVRAMYDAVKTHGVY